MIRLQSPEPAVAVRSVDLTQPLSPLQDVDHATTVEVVVTRGELFVGRITLCNGRRTVSRGELRDAIAEQIGPALLARTCADADAWTHAWTALSAALLPSRTTAPPLPTALPKDVPVTIAVSTYDRPDALRTCLTALQSEVQKSARPVELLVVDNHPQSGRTRPVVEAFPDVRYVAEPRAGLAYARNAGFSAATGAICVTTDDDVIVPDGWLETLLAPFARHDVMAVTGNVMPYTLDTPAQQLFESYGGLGRGATRKVATRAWFDAHKRTAVPTWNLGATANAAVRLSVFGDTIRGMHEALGPGTPTGVGEDTYLFYQLLKKGHVVIYEPDAFVWHRHRRTRRALRKQVYNYSKGHVAYQLATVLEQGDVRGMVRCLVELPVTFAKRARRRLRGDTPYPLSMLALEVAGSLVGPVALWRSYRRVRRLGHSDPVQPSSA